MTKKWFVYLNHALEVAGSLKLGGGPLHAVTWTALIALNTLEPAALWSFALRNICDAFKHDFPALFVHCLHGFGHASMIIGQLFGMSAEQRKTYNGMSIFDRIAVGTASVIVEPKMLDLALNICRGGPSAQLRYICAGGMFMEFWKTRFPGQPVANYRNSSVGYNALHGHEHEAGNLEHTETQTTTTKRNTEIGLG